MDGQYDMACSGHLEKGESMGMAVVREEREEIGIEIDEKDLKYKNINEHRKLKKKTNAAIYNGLILINCQKIQ